MLRKMRAALVAGGAAIAVPAHAQFCPGAAPYVFTDVPANDQFCGYITWLAQSGITGGCQSIDANNRLFCPNGTVTRREMAAFIARGFTGAANQGVTSVATGPGLTGGPITSTGTVGLAATQLLPTVPCSTDQVAKWNGSAWECSAFPAPQVVVLTGGGVSIPTAGGQYPLTPSKTITISRSDQVIVGTASTPIGWSNTPSASGYAFGCIGGTSPMDPGTVYCIRDLATNTGGSFQFSVGPGQQTVTLVASGNLPYVGTWTIAPYLFKGSTSIGMQTFGTNGWVMVMP